MVIGSLEVPLESLHADPEILEPSKLLFGILKHVPNCHSNRVMSP